MPLPILNGSLTLQSSSRPGEPTHSVPKRALLVRMSEETLEALAAFPNHPEIEFDFGDSPGIHIGPTFFPMRGAGEAANSQYELYLRSAPVNKPNAPLKLYADIAGKVMVERELDAIADKVRESNIEAIKAKHGRRMVVLDAPPALSANSKASTKAKTTAAVPKKRKAAAPGTTTTTTKRVSQPIQAKNEGSAVPRVPSPLPPSSHTSSRPALRPRLIQCLAVAPRTAEEVARLFARTDDRTEVLELLESIAETTSTSKNPSTTTYVLRAQIWLEARPYEWSRVSESQRDDMAHRGREALTRLRIPESDPRWAYFRPPSPPPARPIAPSVASSSSSKPVISKENGASSKGDAKRTIQAERKKAPGTSTKARDSEDEPLRTSTSSARAREKAKEELLPPRPTKLSVTRARELDEEALASPALSSTSAKRRIPGSGFKTTRESPTASSGAGTPTSTPQPPQASSKRTGPVDARGRREEPAPSGRASALPPIPPPASREREKEREKDKGATKKRLKDETAVRVKKEETPVRMKDEPSATSTTVMKRKKPAQSSRDEEDERDRSVSMTATSGATKRRKMEEDGAYKPTGGTTKVREKERDSDRDRDRARDRQHREPHPPVKRERESEREISPPPRPKPSNRERERERERPRERSLSPPPPRKMKRDPSPPPTPRTRPVDRGRREREADRDSGSVTGKRRRSPIYTSSSDEGGITSPPARPTHTRGGPSSSTASSSSRDVAPRTRAPLDLARLPKERAELDRLYKELYPEYRRLYKILQGAKSKIEVALMDSADEGSETEFMEAEELYRLQAVFRARATELAAIHDAWHDAF